MFLYSSQQAIGNEKCSVFRLPLEIITSYNLHIFSVFPFPSYDNQRFFDVPIGGRIPDLIQTQINESEDEWQWNDHVQGFSALRHPGMK